MRVDQTDTSASQIDATLTSERHRLGLPAVGMVLTFVVVTDERGHQEALQAATEAARQHPCRILAVIPVPGNSTPQLDAEIHLGHEGGPGETVLMRLRGPLSRHAGSVVLPLLLTDAPTVTWWHTATPQVPAEDQLGVLAQRRVTDAAAATSPGAALTERGMNYREGDTDLAWSRATPWRALLAAALDQPHKEIMGGSVHADRGNPTGSLLAAWLSDKLAVPVERKNSRGPGITAVHLKLISGEIALTRPDGRQATLSRPTQPDRFVGLQRRSISDLLIEELRWLDTDEVYGETIQLTARDLAAATGPPH